MKSLGASMIKYSVGHYYIAGFFRNGDQLYYFSWHNGDQNLMYRTAIHEKNFTGGSNQWVAIGEHTGRHLNLRG